MEELGDVVFIVQLWVQQRLACSERRRKKVLREDKIVGSWQWAIGSWQGKKESAEGGKRSELAVGRKKCRILGGKKEILWLDIP